MPDLATEAIDNTPRRAKLREIQRPFEDFPRMRDRLFNDALLWVCLASTVAAGLSVARTLLTGWKPLFLIHILLLCVLWLTWLGRRQLPYVGRVSVLLAIAWLGTFSGLLQFGPVAMSGLYAIFFAFIAILFLGGRIAVGLVLGNILCLILFGVAASRHWVEFNLDFPVYAHHPLVWTMTVWNLSAYALIFSLIVWRMMQGLLEREGMARALAERQHKIAANVPGVIYQFLLRGDGSMSFPYASDGSLRLFGLNPESLKNDPTPAFALVHPEDQVRVRETIVVSARTLLPIHETFRIVHPKHGLVWIERNSTPERLSNGDTLWHGFMRDVTADKQAEIELRASEQRFRQLFDNVHEAVAVHALDGQVLQANRRMLDMFGLSEEDFCRYSIEGDFSAPGMPVEQLPAIWADVMAGNERHFEWRSRRPLDGKEFEVEVTLSRFRYGSQEAILVTERDITERKRTEAALRASESLFRLLLESSPLPIMVKGVDRELVVLNRRFVETFGYTFEDMPDVDHWWPLAYPEIAYRENQQAEWNQRLALAAQSGTAFAMETVITCKDGVQRPIEAFTSVAGGFGVVLFRDLTQIKRVESELRQAKEAAEEASRAKSTFLASMSHELRTPLNAIIGFAQMLDMGVPVPVDPSHKEAVSHMLGSGRHLLGLINEVLDLTRIEADRLDLTIVAVRLDPLIEEAINMLLPMAANRQIIIRHSDQPSPTILADASRLRQILLNLLSNAVKYNLEGGLVLVSCQTSGSMARITVMDTGPGIAQQKHLQLFQPFQRLGAEQTATEGTGIGLVICKKLAEAMGGRIGFDSKEGVGSHFWVELPLAGGTLL
jgi:PAS domain S-box-containing protein